MPPENFRKSLPIASWFLRGCTAAALAAAPLVAQTGHAADAEISNDSALQAAQEALDAGKFREALSAAERLLARLRDRQSSEETAQVELILGQARQAMGAPAMAEAHFRRALAFEEKTMTGDPDDLPIALTHLASALKDQGRWEEAAPLLQRALEAQRKNHGDEAPETAVACRNMAALQRLRGDYDRSEALFRKALEIRREALGNSAPETLLSLQELAEVEELKGDLPAAEHLAEERLRAVDVRFGAQSPEYAQALAQWAELAERQQHFADAEPRWRRALAAREASGADAPTMAGSLTSLGWCLKSLGRLDEALDLLQRALELRREALGPEHPDTAWSLRNVGWVRRLKGDYNGALPFFTEALKIREHSPGPTELLTLESLSELGDLHWLRGAFVEAAGVFEIRRQRVEKRFGARSKEAAAAWRSLAMAWEAARRWSEARRAAEESLQRVERLLGPAHPQRIEALAYVAQICTEAGDHKAARERYAQVAEWQAQHPETDPAWHAAVVRAWALATLRAGRRAEAETLFLQSRRLHEAAYGPQSPAFLRSLADLWTFYDESGDTARAQQAAEELAHHAEQGMGADSPATLAVFEHLGQLCLAAGNLADARRWLHRAAEGRKASPVQDQASAFAFLEQIAEWFEDSGSPMDAADFRRERLAAVEQRFGAESEQALDACARLGETLLQMGDAAGASELFFRELALAEKRFGHPSTPALTAVIHVAEAATMAGDWPRAIQWNERALAEMEQLPAVRAPQRAAVLLALGEALAGQPAGNDRPSDLFQQAVAAARAAGAGPLAMSAGCRLAAWNARHARLQAAQSALRAALTEAVPAPDETVAKALADTGEAFLDARDRKSAGEAWERALALAPPPGRSAIQAALLQRLARLQWADVERASALLERAVAAAETFHGASSPEAGELSGWLALVRLRQGRRADAVDAAERMLAAERTSLGEGQPETALAALLASGLAWRAGDPERCLADAATVADFAALRWPGIGRMAQGIVRTAAAYMPLTAPACAMGLKDAPAAAATARQERDASVRR